MGGPVVDCHHHLRRTAEDNIVHLDGCGVSNAMALARESAAEQLLVDAGQAEAAQDGQYCGKAPLSGGSTRCVGSPDTECASRWRFAERWVRTDFLTLSVEGRTFG